MSDHGGPGRQPTDFPPSPLRLDPVATSAGRARRYVRQALEAMGLTDLVDTAELGVDELVTNVCLHARTPMVVAIGRTTTGVRIEVSDSSNALPIPQRLGRMATTGRGLMLLEACGTWGVAHGPAAPDGKTVWFEPSEEAETMAVSPWLAELDDA